MANYKKIVFNSENPNGIEMDFTPEEKTEYDTVVEASKDASANNLAKIEKKATDKASAKAKLIAGEPLTEAEADTIVL